MARATRTSSTIPFAVEQAQLIDPSAFRFSTADAEAMKQVGGVLFELGKRELAAKNSLAVNAAVESRRLAKLKMQEFIKNNPDPDTWSMGAFDIINEQGTTFSQQRFNSKTLKKQEVEQKAFKDQLNMEVGIAAAAQNIENDIAISGKNVIDLMGSDTGSPEDAKNIQDAIERLRKAYERKYEPKVAVVHLEETLKQAKKAFYIDQSKLDPDATIALMAKKKKALGKAGKDKEGLGAKDYDDIAASAYSAKALAKRTDDALSEEQRDKIGRQISNPDPDVDTIALIESSNAVPENEQYIWKQRYYAEQKRVTDGVDIITNPEVRSELYSDIFRMLTGELTKKEVLDKAKDARLDPQKPTLNESDYRKIETAVNGQYEQAYIKGMSQVNTHARGTLLNPDSLGFIKNAPIRWKTLADFQEAWAKWIMEQGDKLKISDIFPEGRRLTALHQISDEEAERQEVVMNKDLAAREARKKESGRAAVEAIKKVKAMAEIKEFLGPVNTMNKPASLKEFEESMAQLPTRDARQRYYRKWYNEVKGK